MIANEVKQGGFALGGFMLGVLVGAAMSGVTALMLAPRSGAETRIMMRNRFSQAKDVVQSSAQDVKQIVLGMKAQTE
jgi:gas vesicle protein